MLAWLLDTLLHDPHPLRTAGRALVTLTFAAFGSLSLALALEDLAIATVGGLAVDVAFLVGFFYGWFGGVVASRRFLALYSSEETTA